MLEAPWLFVAQGFHGTDRSCSAGRNSAAMARFDIVHELEKGDHAFIVYEAQTSTGKQFRNSEVYTVRGGKLVATEVYFGWEVPHKVPRGTHAENEGQGHA